jgi:hypothetical protein
MGGGKPRPGDRWVIEFYSTGGSVAKHSVMESRVPKYVRDRDWRGEFGLWLLRKFYPDKYMDQGYRTSWKIQELYRE